MPDQNSKQTRAKPRKVPTTVVIALIGGIATVATAFITAYFSYRAGIEAAPSVSDGMPISTPAPVSVVVRSEQVAIRTYHNKYVTAVNNKPGWSWELRAETETVGAWETFTIHYLDNGKVALETYHGRFVVAEGSAGTSIIVRAEALERGAAEEFTLEQVGDDKIALKTAGGYYVTAGDAGWCWLLRVETAALGKWEQFELIPQ
jgi:hypothetical protein